MHLRKVKLIGTLGVLSVLPSLFGHKNHKLMENLLSNTVKMNELSHDIFGGS